MSANEMNSSEDEVILRVNLPEVDFEAEVEDLRGSGSDIIGKFIILEFG